MPRLLIVSCLAAALLGQGCAGVQNDLVTARGVPETPPAVVPTDNGPIDLWQAPPTDETHIIDPADLVKHATQPDDPSLRDWLNDHPLAKAGIAITIMTLAAGIGLYSEFALDTTTKKKK